MSTQAPPWRDDLDNLLATAGEAQWVEDIDERLTALLEERDSLGSRLHSLESALAAAGIEIGDGPECLLSAPVVERREQEKGPTCPHGVALWETDCGVCSV